MCERLPPYWLVVVDDSPDDRLLVRRCLRNESRVQLTEIDDGESAIEFFTHLSGSNLPDLVLLDIKLPRASGIEVLKRIRECPICRDLAVIVMSSSDEPADIRAALANKATEYVKKSTLPDAHIRNLHSILADYRPVGR